MLMKRKCVRDELIVGGNVKIHILFDVTLTIGSTRTDFSLQEDMKRFDTLFHYFKNFKAINILLGRTYVFKFGVFYSQPRKKRALRFNVRTSSALLCVICAFAAHHLANYNMLDSIPLQYITETDCNFFLFLTVNTALRLHSFLSRNLENLFK